MTPLPFPYLLILLFIISANLCLGGKSSKTFNVKDERRWWKIKTTGGKDYQKLDFKDPDDLYQDYQDVSEPNGTLFEKLFSS